MNNTEVLNQFFIWEEKNSTEQKTKLENNGVNEHKDITIETKNDLTPNDWRDITDAKLRKKMRDKAYYEANKDKKKAQRKYYYEVNKDKICKQSKTNYNINRDKRKAQLKAYYEANKDKKKDYYNISKNKIKIYNNSKYKTDIQFKLSHNLRSRLCKAINRNQKKGSAVDDLGCTVEQLKQHLESKFLPGMSWDNWTVDGWHIDHIKPLDSFDLTDRNQLLEACHYTNLQPLWANDNLVKSNKLK